MTTHMITVAGFAAIAVAFFALEVAGRRPGSRIPALGDIFGFMMRTRVTRVLILVSWVWVGWHFFAR